MWNYLPQVTQFQHRSGVIYVADMPFSSGVLTLVIVFSFEIQLTYYKIHFFNVYSSEVLV